MSREMPKGWVVRTLGDLCEDGLLTDGDWIETKDQDPNGSVRLIQLSDIGDGVFLDKTRRFISDETAQRLKVTYVQPNDILLARMPDPLGRCCLLPLDARAITAVDVCIIRPSSSTDRSWLAHLLNSPEIRAVIKSQGSGTTRTRVSRKSLAALTLPVPPLSEQRRIAEILSSVDDAIAATRAVIEQTRKVKQGVLERLLSKGIGHTRFKQTEIGEIPEGWTLSRISEIASVKGGKRMPAGRPFADVRTDFPYIRVSDFKNGSVDPSNLVYVLPEDQKLIARYTISCRDVYISIAGTIGICGMVPEYLEGAQLTENAAKITVKNEEQIIPEFLALALSSDIAQRQIAAAKGVGGGVPKLALFRIEGIELPVPPAKEQAEIVQHLQAVNDAIAACELDYEHQVRMKQALMSDLLTGRKRVTSDLPLAAE